MIPQVYIAGAYSAPLILDRMSNIERAAKVARLVVQAGAYARCPHLLGAQCDSLERSWEWWMEATSGDLERCDAVVVAPGWEESRGTKQEIEQAGYQCLPVFYATSSGLPASFFSWLTAREAHS